MQNIALLIQYEGTSYSGWQSQPNSVTLQAVIEEKISAITGGKVNLVAAGRTDAGVHALGQVASFKTESLLDPATIKNALNALLPPDIRVMAAACADDDFHPRFDAQKKSYFYIISAERVVSPFIYRYAWKLPYAIDLEAMKAASLHLLGSHDFSAFRAAGCGAKTTVRNMISITVENTDAMGFMASSISGSFIKLRFEADAFLRHMVRNITGTLVDVGRGKILAADMREILVSRDRKKAGPTAPACGLFMEQVWYEPLLRF